MPKDRLTTRTAVPSAATWCSVTQFNAAMIWLTSLLPSVVANLIDSRPASGATPSCTAGSNFLIVLPVSAAASRPAMMPAMKVPCPKVS